MFIIIDQNEGIDRNKIKKGVKEKKTLANARAMARLKGYFGEIEFAELTCGDINIILDDGKLLAIERKRPGDFLGGIASGRVFRQVENMAKNAAWSCIVLEGVFSFDKNDMAVIPIYSEDDGKIVRWESTEWKGASVRGAMYAIQWSGCPIIMVDPISIPKVVHDIAIFCSKPAEHAQSLGRRRIVSFPPITLPEEIISALPGVGLKRARALLEFTKRKNINEERVPSLGEALSWASMLNLIDKGSRPEGWGKTTILNVRVALGLEMGEYLTVQEDKRQVAERKELERKYKKNEQSTSAGVKSKPAARRKK
jgi:ERCC4-type nuclease